MITNGPLVKTTLANYTFSDSLGIHGSKRSVLLVEKKNGHTASDAIMIVPKEGIAFMGNLLFTNMHPYLADGSPTGTLSTLNYLYNDTSLQKFVPMHGMVTDKIGLKEMSNYISDLSQLVQDAYNAKQTDSTIKKYRYLQPIKVINLSSFMVSTYIFYSGSKNQRKKISVIKTLVTKTQRIY